MWTLILYIKFFCTKLEFKLNMAVLLFTICMATGFIKTVNHIHKDLLD